MIKTAYSSQPELGKAIEDIKDQLAQINPNFITFFASSYYSPDDISSQMAKLFPYAQVIGCSSSGEIISGKMLKNSIVVMAFDNETIADVKLALVENISKENNVEKAFKTFEEYYDEPMKQMDYKAYVGMVFIDGLSLAEEKIMDTIGNLTSVLFIGGSAGDDLKFEKTYIYANGKTYTNAALLTLIKPAKGYDFIKTQSFCTLDKKLVATKVNEEKREVLEFNNLPAAQAYAQALENNPEAESVGDYFMKNPVGLMVGEEPYVRSPQRVVDNKMIFYCQLKEGMELSLLDSTDIIFDTKKALDEKKKELEHIEGIINFNCILRTLDLEKQNRTQEYGEVFSDIPTIGFSTYGEEFVGHINQTATMLIFK